MINMTLKKLGSIALLGTLIFVLGILAVPTETFAAGNIKARITKYVENHPKVANTPVVKKVVNSSPAAVSQYIQSHPNVVSTIQNNPVVQNQISNSAEQTVSVPVVISRSINSNNDSDDVSDRSDNSRSSAVNDTSQSCPFYPTSNRTVVTFNKTLVWGKTTEYSKSVSLPAGNYRVYSFAYDGYEGRNTVTQHDESFFVEFRSGSSMIARSNPTPDLADRISSARWDGVVNSSLSVNSTINTILVRHSNHIQAGGARDSVTAGCIALERLDTPPPPPPNNNLTGSCSVNPTSTNIGGYLNWSATASGGTGSYSYSWTGTDGLYGNSSLVSKSYGSSGTKTGTVTITSGSQSVSYTCNGVVNGNNDNYLSVSCDADDSTIDVDEDVTYRAEVSGGTGSYSYDWDGSENLRGSSRSVTWSYDDDGSKYATVTVTSGNQTATASCRVRVDEDDNDDEDLDVSCYANPTNPRIGERMNWYADVDGGDGDYDYDWSGTDGLDSSSRNPSMTYYDSGTKTATVRVRSNGETETATCRVNVNQNSVLAYSQSYPNQVLDAVYLNQVPYTGMADNMSVIWFTLGLALFSAWIAYIVIAYKKQVGELE